jgi:hypothetical protein
MFATVRAALFVGLCSLVTAGSASAAPITWQASGQISLSNDPFALWGLSAIPVGTPWALEVTFDPDSPGMAIPSSMPTFRYPGAISVAHFQAGAFAYTNTSPSSEIWINSALPVSGAWISLAGTGLVQFQWASGGWSGGGGGPNLNNGVMIATYNDMNAASGAIPTVPDRSSAQSALGGLLWDTHPGPSGPPFKGQLFSPSFNPVLAPEPATWILVGTGVSALVVRRRRRVEAGS